VYARPELKVWDDATIDRIDALVAKQARTPTRTPGLRKHLSSSLVRCAGCGGAVSAVRSGKSNHWSYVCTKTRTKACVGIGYRAEHFVDKAVVLAASMLL